MSHSVCLCVNKLNTKYSQQLLIEDMWNFSRFFWLCQGAQGVTLSVCVSVCLSGTSLSKGLNLHLRAVWVSLRSV